MHVSPRARLRCGLGKPFRKGHDHAAEAVALGVTALTTSVVLASSALADAATTNKPAITAKPSHVMVSGATTLTGTGFPAGSRVQLSECGRTFWLAPEQPCNTDNTITVETNRYGRFKATFHVELCPDASVGKVVTERTCYIGRVQFGEDTGELQLAARIIVTYP
jgi:hypothetical protein